MFDIKRLSNIKIMFNGKTLYRVSNLNSCRTIFMTTEYVIKFDRCQGEEGGYRSSHQCPREYNFWNKVKKTKYAKYFVPVLQFGNLDGYDYVVQPRIDRRRNKATPEIFKTLERLENEFNFFDLDERNYTIKQNKLLIFDYAL